MSQASEPGSPPSSKSAKAAPTIDPAQRVLRFWVNDEETTVLSYAHETLLEILRERLELTGTKHGCEVGECGACTVLVDDRARLACLVLADELDGAHVMTVEGLADGPRLHPLQEAFVELGASQCGYCTSGMLLSAKALLDANPSPTPEEIRAGLSGNLCRCTGYASIVDAVSLAAKRMGGEA
jgi:carbon-monoxide dehydrogenase small subunit